MARMRVPPTTLLIHQDSLDYVRTIEEARWYETDDQSITVEGDRVVYGELFVAAAIFRNIPLVTVNIWAGEPRSNHNPCGEQLLGHPSATNLTNNRYRDD